jgi:hypothetical protein
MRYIIAPAPADDSTVWYLNHSIIVQCRSVLYVDRIRIVLADYQTPAPADKSYCEFLYPTIISRRERDVLCSSLYGARWLHDFVNSSSKFTTTVV